MAAACCQAADPALKTEDRVKVRQTEREIEREIEREKERERERKRERERERKKNPGKKKEKHQEKFLTWAKQLLPMNKHPHWQGKRNVFVILTSLCVEGLPISHSQAPPSSLHVFQATEFDLPVYNAPLEGPPRPLRQHPKVHGCGAYISMFSMFHAPNSPAFQGPALENCWRSGCYIPSILFRYVFDMPFAIARATSGRRRITAGGRRIGRAHPLAIRSSLGGRAVPPDACRPPSWPVHTCRHLFCV
jgi:hypothetical protein